MSGASPLDRPHYRCSPHAFAIAFILAAYLVAMHCATDYTGTIALLFLGRATDSQVVRQIASIVYVALPAVLLIAGMAIGLRQFFLLAQVLAGAGIAVAIVDLIVAPGAGAISGTSATMQVQLFVALSVLCWHVLVFSWARQLRLPVPGSPMRMSPVRWLAFMPIVGVTLWSLGVGVSAADQAKRIANGRPYCIATTTAAAPKRDYGPIQSLEELRGVRLYTWATGYKSTSSWYFHAVLIVGETQPFEYWNWSIRRTQFEPFVEPEGFHVTLKDACRPVASFLSHLSWF